MKKTQMCVRLPAKLADRLRSQSSIRDKTIDRIIEEAVELFAYLPTDEQIRRSLEDIRIQSCGVYDALGLPYPPHLVSLVEFLERAKRGGGAAA